MRKYASMLGVTLLEVMLVLAVAAMIIVMSVRYYQSASASQQTNSMLQMIHGIVAVADGLAQGTGSFASGNVSTATVTELMPSQNMTSPWGSAVTLGSVTANTYAINIPIMPSAVCYSITSKLGADTRFSGMTGCSANAQDFSVTFTNG